MCSVFSSAVTHDPSPTLRIYQVRVVFKILHLAIDARHPSINRSTLPVVDDTRQYRSR